MVRSHEKMKPDPPFQAFIGGSEKPMPEIQRRYELLMRLLIDEDAYVVRGAIIRGLPIHELKGEMHQISSAPDRCG
jgi:hypothetical protein